MELPTHRPPIWPLHDSERKLLFSHPRIIHREQIPKAAAGVAAMIAGGAEPLAPARCQPLLRYGARPAAVRAAGDMLW